METWSLNAIRLSAAVLFSRTATATYAGRTLRFATEPIWTCGANSVITDETVKGLSNPTYLNLVTNPRMSQMDARSGLLPILKEIGLFPMESERLLNLTYISV
jgi:hypothetical protein